MTAEAIGRPPRRRRGPLVATLSAGAHIAVLLALAAVGADAPATFEPQPMQVALIDPPPPRPPAPPAPQAGEPAPAAAAPALTPPPKPAMRRTPPPVTIEPLPASDSPAADVGGEMSESDLAGAAVAGSSVGSGAGGTGEGGGGQCDMLAWLQAELRKDARVKAAVRQVDSGKAIRMWDGDWTRHPSQEGGGLASVREAIIWEIAYAPEACRRQPIRGLALITLSDGPGAARLVIGGDRWRWSDLLHARGVRR